MVVTGTIMGENTVGKKHDEIMNSDNTRIIYK